MNKDQWIFITGWALAAVSPLIMVYLLYLALPYHPFQKVVP